jgi:ABC-type multidrug transport system ATPase subunit
MPQELALFPDFTISETLFYFGRIYHMTNEAIGERTRFLIKMLDLPEGDRKVKALSGGQQRRASIAVTLLHQPPLLILDEPTVGKIKRDESEKAEYLITDLLPPIRS